MKFNFPSFLAGLALGIVATFAVLNGGACRPSPTPTDEGTPVKVEAPKVEIVAPVAPAAPAPVVPVEVKPAVSVPPVADAKAPVVESKAAPAASSAIAVTVSPVPE